MNRSFTMRICPRPRPTQGKLKNAEKRGGGGKDRIGPKLERGKACMEKKSANAFSKKGESKTPQKAAGGNDGKRPTGTKVTSTNKKKKKIPKMGWKWGGFTTNRSTGRRHRTQPQKQPWNPRQKKKGTAEIEKKKKN